MMERNLRRMSVAVAVVMLVAVSGLLAQTETQPDPSFGQVEIGQVNIKGARIAQVDTSHIRMAVDVTITPGRSAVLENFKLASLRLNGLHLFAEELDQPITLVKGQPMALPSIYVSAAFRDLTTVEPLRSMIEKQSVLIQGQIVADLRLNFMEKLAMHTQHPRLSITLSEDVPVTAGASPLQRQAALSVLSLLELGMEGSSVLRKNLPALESPWMRDVESMTAANLVHLKSSYTLSEQGASYPVVFDQLGFRLVQGPVIATAEMQAPWEYDPEFQGRIKSGEAKLLKGSSEIQMTSVAGAADSPLLLTHSDFTLEERGKAESDALILHEGGQEDRREGKSHSGFAKVTVRRRASPGSLAVIALRTPAAAGFKAVPEAIVQQDAWQKVAVYRLRLDETGKATGTTTTVDAIQLSARRDGQSIRLDHPLDASFYGSPILVPEGVLGIVQDEETGAFLPADLTGSNAAGTNH
jgi:hypothetical protein